MANSALKTARKAAGLTQEELAGEVGLSVSQINRFETGKREPRAVDIKRIAERLGVTVGQLLQSPTGERMVHVAGFVGAGSEAFLFGEGQADPDDYVPAPDDATDKTTALEIRGESLGALFDHWIVFYDDEPLPPQRNMVGKLCICWLPDGHVYVKKLMRGQLAGHWNLHSNTEPPIYDVVVERAVRVKNMAPR